MPRCEFLVLITLTTEYAPVTISDNEALGSDKEGEYDENEDIVNGMRLGCIHSGVIQYSQWTTGAVVPSNPGNKCKRSTRPSEDEQLTIEADDDVADEVVPRIQNKTSRLNCQQSTPQSDLPPEASPYHPPSPPHFTPQDDTDDNDNNKTNKLGKPKSKHTVKALQKAKIEVCQWVFLV